DDARSRKMSSRGRECRQRRDFDYHVLAVDGNRSIQTARLVYPRHALETLEELRRNRAAPFLQVKMLRPRVIRARRGRILSRALIVQMTAFRGRHVHDALGHAAQEVDFLEIQAKSLVESAGLIEIGCANRHDSA